jgi:putative membrane protein insertion efficiency factor
MHRSIHSKPITRQSSPGVVSRPEATHAGPAAALVLGLLRSYKLLISPLFTGSCRFYPSCADYMKEAVHVHGAVKGVWLGMRRLGRCHPLGNHGVDPVPRP